MSLIRYFILLFVFLLLVCSHIACQLAFLIHHLQDEVWSDYRVLEGHFRSPLDVHLPDIMPEEVKKAHFQIILPTTWQEENYKPVCLHLAGTGDHVSKICIGRLIVIFQNISLAHHVLKRFASCYCILTVFSTFGKEETLCANHCYEKEVLEE